MKKIPMRMCVVTRDRHEKKDLFRVVKDKDGKVSIDLTGKANGKGAYILKDADAINKCAKNKILDKVLEVEIPESIYKEMLKNI